MAGGAIRSAPATSTGRTAGGPGEHQTEGAAAWRRPPGRAGPGALGVRGPGRLRRARSIRGARSFSADSGSIVRGHVGDDSGRQLNESPAGGRWAFSTSPNGARLRPVHTPSMPMACSSDRHAAGRRGPVTFTQARAPRAAARAGAHGAHAAHHASRARRHHRRVWRERDAAAPRRSPRSSSSSFSRTVSLAASPSRW